MSYLDYLRSLATTRRDKINWNELQTIVDQHEIFDDATIEVWRDDPLFVERAILQHIVDAFQLAIHFEFISGRSNSSQAFAVKSPDGSASCFFLDEVLDMSIMEVFLTVWAAVYNPEYTDLCKGKLSSLFKDRLIERTRYSCNAVDIIKDTHMSERAIVQAFDMYWSAWTFVAGHELFHIMNREPLTVREEEFKADRFGFQVLIRFINDQKKSLLPKELDCFYQDYYLVPCMLMYLFRALDLVRKNDTRYGDEDVHPSPEDRMQAIIDLFDSDVPDDMDTENGNAFLATFLDTFDLLRVSNDV